MNCKEQFLYWKNSKSMTGEMQTELATVEKNEELLALLYDLLEERKQILNARDFLICD